MIKTSGFQPDDREFNSHLLFQYIIVKVKMLKNIYNLKKSDIGKCNLYLIITDKTINIRLCNHRNGIDLVIIELPNSKYCDFEKFPNNLIYWINEFDDNAIKAIRSRNKRIVKGTPFVAYLRKNGYRFIINFLPMYKRTLKRQWQKYFQFKTFESFEKIFYDTGPL